jgi:hypothetical protein
LGCLSGGVPGAEHEATSGDKKQQGERLHLGHIMPD